MRVDPLGNGNDRAIGSTSFWQGCGVGIGAALESVRAATFCKMGNTGSEIATESAAMVGVSFSFTMGNDVIVADDKTRAFSLNIFEQVAEGRVDEVQLVCDHYPERVNSKDGVKKAPHATLLMIL